MENRRRRRRRPARVAGHLLGLTDGRGGRSLSRKWRGMIDVSPLSLGMVYFQKADLGDARRTQRLVKLFDELRRHPGGTLPQKLCESRKLQRHKSGSGTGCLTSGRGMSIRLNRPSVPRGRPRVLRDVRFVCGYATDEGSRLPSATRRPAACRAFQTRVHRRARRE